MRVVLVHLNVEVADDDPRTAEEIAAYIDDALVVGMDGHEGAEGLAVTVALADEV